MTNTMNRRIRQSSALRAASTGWARAAAASALASIALTAMLGAPAGLASSIGVGAELLAALVIAGSAAALLWTSDATVAWRWGIAASLFAGVGLVGGWLGILCAVVVISTGVLHLGWRTLIGGTR